MNGGFEADVLAAEKARCEAMLQNSTANLDRILDDRLHFSHATGAVDDKPAYIAKMSAGAIEYSAIELADERVTALGNEAAMLTARMTTSVVVGGTAKTLRNRTMSVWTLSEGRWQMLAFQSTPIKD